MKTAQCSFKVYYTKLKQMTKDGSLATEIKERFVGVVPFLPQMTVQPAGKCFYFETSGNI